MSMDHAHIAPISMDPPTTAAVAIPVWWPATGVGDDRWTLVVSAIKPLAKIVQSNSSNPVIVLRSDQVLFAHSQTTTLFTHLSAALIVVQAKNAAVVTKVVLWRVQIVSALHNPVPVLVPVLVLVLDPVLVSMNWIYTFSTTTAITATNCKRWTTQLLVLQNIGERMDTNSICLPLDYVLHSL